MATTVWPGPFLSFPAQPYGDLCHQQSQGQGSEPSLSLPVRGALDHSKAASQHAQVTRVPRPPALGHQSVTVPSVAPNPTAHIPSGQGSGDLVVFSPSGLQEPPLSPVSLLELMPAGHGASLLETPTEGRHSPGDSSGWRRTDQSHPGPTGNKELSCEALGRVGGQALQRFTDHMSPGPGRAGRKLRGPVGVRRSLGHVKHPPCLVSFHAFPRTGSLRLHAA